MARATYGDIITDLKGSIGGITFQHNTSGKIARLRPFRKKFNSAKQITRIKLFYAKLRNWNALTLENQILWNAFASIHPFTDPFGNIKTLTGLQWYISINSNLELINQPIISSPPVWSLPTSAPIVTLDVTHVGIFLNVVSPDPEGYDNIIISLTPPILNTSTKLNGKFRLIYTIPTGTWVPIDVTSYFETYFGLTWSDIVATGNFRIACEIACINTASGLASPVTSTISQLKPLSIRITYTPGNVPVFNLADWNTFFDTATYANTPFTSFNVTGNTVDLFGATNLIIKANLFSSNITLTKFEDYTNQVTRLNLEAFRYCTALTTFTANGVTVLSNYPLADCPSLTTLYFPLLVGDIGNYNFMQNSSLISVYIPLVTTIGSLTFQNCTSLKYVDISSLTEINGNSVFAECRSLTKISIPLITYLLNCVFYNCVNLYSVYCPIVTTLGSQPFYGCKIPTIVNFPLVTATGTYAFDGFIDVTTIDLSKCTNLGGTEGDDHCFRQYSAETITLTIPRALEVDGDIVYLKANNNVTVIYSD